MGSGVVVATRRSAEGALAWGRCAGGGQSGLAPRPLSGGAFGSGPLNSLSAAQWQAEAERLAAAGCGLAAVMLVGPVGGTAKCFVRRTKGLLGAGAYYDLRIENSDRFLISARRRAKNKCSSYLLALTEAGVGQVSPFADEAVAKVRTGKDMHTHYSTNTIYVKGELEEIQP
jgi:hypothetical protein